MPRPLASLAAILLLAGCSLVGIRSGYEQPAYDVLETVDDRRRYDDRVASLIGPDLSAWLHRS